MRGIWCVQQGGLWFQCNRGVGGYVHASRQLSMLHHTGLHATLQPPVHQHTGLHALSEPICTLAHRSTHTFAAPCA